MAEPVNFKVKVSVSSNFTTYDLINPGGTVAATVRVRKDESPNGFNPTQKEVFEAFNSLVPIMADIEYPSVKKS